jgi:maleate cis-trans isomerase
MARIGLLVPSANTVVEPEFWHMAPPGITLHAARMRNSTCDVEDSIRMLDHVERASYELGSANVNVIAFACTASSFVKGADGERDLEAMIERASGATAVTTSGAVVAALKSLGARRLAMYTPYPAELNRREVTFLRSHGLDVVQERGLGIADAVAIADVSAAQLLEFVHDAPPPDEADTLFVSCTNLATLDSIAALEREFDRPVISSNTATFWRLLQTLDVEPSEQAPGRLFARPAVTAAG